MKNKLLYHKNVDRFALCAPAIAYRLESVDCSQLQFCHTHIGEPNLVDTQGESPLYLHSQEGAAWEAQNWAKRQPLAETDVLFVYGLGLGYYYFALSDWLKESKKRYLVFIEDDLRVIRRFLETEAATEILANPRVVVYAAPFLQAKQHEWKDLHRDAFWPLWAFALARINMSALQAYFVSRFVFYDALALQWYAAVGRSRRRLLELAPASLNALFRNFYANLPYIWQAIPASALFGQLPSVPALLAGAGPSIEKQLPLLSTLTDQALLMAGGSGMNAVTQAGIMPHVGAAIDPTPAQASRQLTSFAFEVPVFYKNRYYDEAFLQLHGPHLYVCGSGVFPIGNWFEKQLGIDDSQEIIMGVSTSNFLLEIAALLKCDPIILVGTDLAYTKGARYAMGVTAHPTDPNHERQALKGSLSGRLTVPGLQGQEVETRLEWRLESIYMTAFKERNPQMQFLNATEGGMPIRDVPNVSLKETAASFLKRSWDMQGLLHGAIQNAATKMQMTSAQVMDATALWQQSLEKCLLYVKKLKTCLSDNRKLIQKGSSHFLDPYGGQAALWQVELHEEIAYEHLLSVFDVIFDTLHKKEERNLILCRGTKKEISKRISLEIKRLKYLEQQLHYHLKMLKRGQKRYQQYQQALLSTKKTAKPMHANINYLYDENKLIIKEPELELEIASKFMPPKIPSTLLPAPGQESTIAAIIGERAGQAEGQMIYFYPSGKVRVEAYYVDGQLHGPWSYYGDLGNLLVRSWYVQGKRQGRACYYYDDGSLYSMQTYRHGKAHGTWRYYYREGTLKTVMPYLNGFLDGCVQLYYPNGYLKKEQHFKQGQLSGKERMWTVKNKLVFEISY